MVLLVVVALLFNLAALGCLLMYLRTAGEFGRAMQEWQEADEAFHTALDDAGKAARACAHEARVVRARLMAREIRNNEE